MRYQIEGELGRGGMGVVYAAFDTSTGRRVALKRLLAERFRNQNELARATTLFEREYHTLSQLAHPNVISVFDYGIDPEGPYYTMERLTGTSLRACAPLPWTEAASLLRDVASALAIIHSRRLVHRDVTPLNIYRSEDGSARLIDFGAMIPMGVAKDVVGTPAFIAPECLQHQSLDGQTDLYSLGACLYFALSGRHAYPAASIAALRDSWLSPPRPLASLVPDIPGDLDALVTSLLSMQSSGRPRTAAEVYERLTSLAGLPRSEQGQVGRAYLTKPLLIGRSRPLAVLREMAQRSAQGHGYAALISGPAGIGRTRLLDAALLEAKLAGMRVARADASDAQQRSLGIAARLLQNLADEGSPVDELLRQHGLESLLAEDVQAGAALLGSEARRDQTLNDLCKVFFALAERTPLALAVDDLNDLEESSLALLASLAARVRRHRLLLLTSHASDAAARLSAGLRLLQKVAKNMPLESLEPEQSRQLLSSIFGEVPNLDVLSSLFHARCLGSPGGLMDAAQDVIESGLVRYEGGSWSITGNAEAISARLDNRTEIEQLLAPLSRDARDLLEALALDRDAIMELGDYSALTEHGDRARMHRALSELIESRWLISSRERQRFRREDQRRLLASRIDPERARRIHARLAERCGERPELPPIYQAHHFAKAQLYARALAPMDAMSAYVDANTSADIVRAPISLETLQLFSELYDVPGAHPAAPANYAGAFVMSAMYQGFPELAATKVDTALREITRFTGVSDYAALADLPPGERLTQALTRANERCQQPGIGGMDLLRLMRRQTQLCLATAICANFMAEPRLLAHIPDISPFVVLSPVLAIAARVLDGLCKLARGQIWSAWDMFESAYAELTGPAAAAIDPLTLLTLKLSTMGYICALQAEHGCHGAEAILDEYAKLIQHHAESVRARYHLARGDSVLASASRKRCELLSVQANSMLETRNAEAWAMAGLFALSDDLLGLRQTQATLLDVARKRPGWHCRAEFARSQILRCQGQIDVALVVSGVAMQEIDALHADFVVCAAAHLDLLNLARRLDEVLRLGTSYLEQARRHELPSYRIELMLARAHSELGQLDPAEALFQSALAALQSRNCAGVLLGRCYEIGARIALGRRDAALFGERAELCANQYAVAQNSSLALRYAGLLREGARAGLTSAGSWESAREGEEAVKAALRELAAVTSDTAFHARALDLLMRSSGAAAGFLYARTEDGLRQVARTHTGQWTSTIDLDREAQQYFDRESAADESTKPIAESELENSQHSIAIMGNELWSCPLARTQEGERVLEGVVLLFVPRSRTLRPAPVLLEELAQLMTVRTQHAEDDP